jgi:hypothetical protein
MEQSYQRGSKELSDIIIRDSVVIGNVGGKSTKATTAKKMLKPLLIRTKEENEQFRKKILEAMDCNIWDDEIKKLAVTGIDISTDESLEEEIELWEEIKYAFS